MIVFQLLISCIVVATVYSAQIAYSRIIPYDPRYVIRRPPVRRSMEIEPQIRLPLTRYFPQVDTQVAAVPYIAQAEPVAPAAYRLANGEVYALPSKWAEEAVPLSALERNEENDYGSYDYRDNEFSPVYANQNSIYAVPQETESQDADGDAYNDFMVNYFLGELQPTMEETEFSEVQRRSQEAPIQDDYGKDVKEAAYSKKQNLTGTVQKVSSTPATSVALQATSTVPPASYSSAPATAPKLNIAAHLLPKVLPKIQRYPQYAMNRRSSPQNGLWSEFEPANRGQKEYPIFRQTSVENKKSAMTTLEEQLARAKNSGYSHKDAFPLIEKLLAANQGKDPLAEQLDSLKYPSM